MNQTAKKRRDKMRRMIVVNMLVGVISILMMALLSVTPAIGGDAGAVVDLALLPESQKMKINDTFDLTIEAQCSAVDRTSPE